MTTAKKSCHKRRFSDEYQVSKWLKRMQTHVDKGNGPQHAPIRYYYHHECKGFHVTSRPLREEV
jgi:hypothetical protein